jgi:hypothetical protein
MPHKPSAINPWTYASQFNSGEAATSTEYNQLVNNVSLLYAKPWLMAYLNTAESSVANGTTLFTGTGTTTISSSAATPSVGQIILTSGTGAFTVPVGGVYRVTMTMNIALQATGIGYAMRCGLTGGATSNNASFSIPRQTSSTTTETGGSTTFIFPMSAVGTSGAYATTLTFSTVNTGTITTLNGSTAPSFVGGTYVQIEYLGTSIGSI